MPQALTISLERELPELATYTKAAAGKALAREAAKLDLAARIRKVPALTSLLAESQAALAEQLRTDGFDPSKMRLPPEQWFAAADGLISVRGLHEYVEANLNNFKQPNPILRDLAAAEAVLVAAQAAGCRFHFTKVSL